MIGGLLSGKLILIFGILGALLFSYAFSQLITEVAYLLYLKTQPKSFLATVFISFFIAPKQRYLKLKNKKINK